VTALQVIDDMSHAEAKEIFASTDDDHFFLQVSRQWMGKYPCVRLSMIIIVHVCQWTCLHLYSNNTLHEPGGSRL